MKKQTAVTQLDLSQHAKKKSTTQKQSSREQLSEQHSDAKDSDEDVFQSARDYPSETQQQQEAQKESTSKE